MAIKVKRKQPLCTLLLVGITEQVHYLDVTGVHMSESKAEQLAINEQEMWCAGLAACDQPWCSVGARETV